MCVNKERSFSQNGEQRGTAPRCFVLMGAVLCFLFTTGRLRGQEAANQASGTRAAQAPSDPNDPMAPHDPGIYYLEQNSGSRRMIPLEPEPLSVTAGYWKWKAAVTGSEAHIRIRESRPTFYFYLPPNQIGFPGVPSGGPTAMSPREFALTELESKKEERDVPLEKAGVAHKREPRGAVPQDLQAQRASLSVQDKAQVQFAYEKVTSGIYKIQPQTELNAGEYGFLYSGSLQMPEGRLFDFGIEGAK